MIKKLLLWWKSKEALERMMFILASLLTILTFISIFTSFNLLFTSDAAAANVLSREQILTMNYFPESWYSSTGFSLISYNTLMVPLSYLFNNQLLIRNTAVAIAVVITLVVLYYFFRNYLYRGGYCIFLCMFFANNSETVIQHSFAEAAYLLWIPYYLLLVIVFIKVYETKLETSRKKACLLLGIWVIYISIGGTQVLMYYHIPILGGMFLTIIIKHYKSSFDEIKHLAKKIAVILGIILGATIVGQIMSSFIGKYFNYSGTYNIEYYEQNILDNTFRVILQIIGYTEGVELFTVEGIMNFVRIIIFCYMMYCVVMLYKKYEEQTFRMKFFMNTVLVLNVFTLYLNMFIYSQLINVGRYFFRSLIGIYILVSCYINKYVIKENFMTKSLFIIGMLLFVIPCNIINVGEIATYSSTIEEEKELVTYLEEQGLKKGYATYWNASYNMVLSDFEIEIGNIIYSEEYIIPYYWLTADRYYSYDLSENTFLLMTESQKDIFEKSLSYILLGTPIRKLEFSDLYIYEYDYNVASNNFGGIYNNIDIIEALYLKDSDESVASHLSINEDDVVFGPYINLEKGDYEVKVVFEEIPDSAKIELTYNSGEEILCSKKVSDIETELAFQVSQEIEGFEVVITAEEAVLESVILNKTPTFWDVTDDLIFSNDLQGEEKDLVIDSKTFIYGPYMELNEGTYMATIDFEYLEGETTIILTYDNGAERIVEKERVDIENVITFEIEEDIENFEVLIITEGKAKLENATIEKIE